jgi:hypothetical protein
VRGGTCCTLTNRHLTTSMSLLQPLTTVAPCLRQCVCVCVGGNAFAFAWNKPPPAPIFIILHSAMRAVLSSASFMERESVYVVYACVCIHTYIYSRSINRERCVYTHIHTHTHTYIYIHDTSGTSLPVLAIWRRKRHLFPTLPSDTHTHKI